MFFTAPVKCRSGIRHFTAILVGFALDLVWIRVNAVAKWRLSAVKTNVVWGVKKIRRNFLTPLFHTVDPSKGFRQFDESFRPPFSKGGAVEGAKPSSPPSGGEIPLWRFLFAKLFLCACFIKEKAGWEFMHIDSGCTFCRQPARRAAKDLWLWLPCGFWVYKFWVYN